MAFDTIPAVLSEATAIFTACASLWLLARFAIQFAQSIRRPRGMDGNK